MARPIIHTLTPAHRRVAELVAECERNHAPAFVPDLVEKLGFAGESSITPTLKKMVRNGYAEVVRAGIQGRLRIVRLTEKGRLAMGVGGLPLLGSIPAGLISDAAPEVEQLMDPADLIPSQPNDFLLRVRGESMIGDGILDGDYVLIRPNQRLSKGVIAAVCVGDDREATLKHVYQEGKTIRLKASNPRFKDIVVKSDQVQIAGILKGVVRHVGRR